MSCEHPGCLMKTNAICESHCHLSLCEQHRIQHEQNLLDDLETRLNILSNPIVTLLQQSQLSLSQSEQARQSELDQLDSLVEYHLSLIGQRTQLSKKTNELILNIREHLVQYKNGDKQLTKDKYQEIENLSNEIQTNLHLQYQLNQEIQNEQNSICSWTRNQASHAFRDVECIVISDSEDAISLSSIDVTNHTRHQTITDNVALSNNKLNDIKKSAKSKRKSSSAVIRDFCPLTHYGVYGLNNSYDSLYLCSEKNNRRRYLYIHFTRTHHLKSSIANQLIKAIQNNCDPMTTKIFPLDNKQAFVEPMQCPFDESALEFSRNNSIPNTPCYTSLMYYNLKNHLRTVHSITKLNADLINNAMKTYGSISHVQFEEDLCTFK